MPDLTTLGKAIANGFPLAAIGGAPRHLEHFTTNPDGDVHFGGTYNGNAVGVEAALATIEQLEDGRVHEHVFRARRADARRAREIADARRRPGGRRRLRLAVRAVLHGRARSTRYEDVLRNDTELFLRYRRELIARGVFEMPESLGRSHISAAHTGRRRRPLARGRRGGAARRAGPAGARRAGGSGSDGLGAVSEVGGRRYGPSSPAGTTATPSARR